MVKCIIAIGGIVTALAGLLGAVRVIRRRRRERRERAIQDWLDTGDGGLK